MSNVYMRHLVRAEHRGMYCLPIETSSTDQSQKFVAQLAMIPNLKIDYVVLNAGVLRYPNVSPTSSIQCKGAALTVVEGH
jgi:hypothetical protein